MPKINKSLNDKNKKELVKEKNVRTKKTTEKSKNSLVKKAKDSKKTDLKKSSKVKGKVDVKSTKSPKKATSTKKNVASKNSKAKVKKSVKVNDKKLTKKQKTTKIPKKPEFLLEYYDLPYRYNETVVKVLAQTPKRLFVYWEVSDKDRQTYLNAFGENFFNETYPVLLVHNEDMNYTFEVPINDFANSWYLDIQDTKSKYVVQLGRKFRNAKEATPNKEVIKEEHINFQNDFVYITDSNRIETPNDHILFERLGNQVTYRNMKNGQEYKKDISDILDKLERSYKDVNIEELYKELYGDEISGDILSNPSSGGLTSSGFKAK